jgi:cytochrome c oxidase subunit 3
MILIYKWIKETRIERKYKGYIIKKEERIDMIGYKIFIITEIIIFISLFGVYLYSSIKPSIEINSIWEPKGIDKIDEISIPLLNTIILISSALIITSSHFSSLLQSKIEGMEKGIRLVLFFLVLQYLEYINSSFDITSSIYGNIFYILTGLHVLHMIIRRNMIIYRLYK